MQWVPGGKWGSCFADRLLRSSRLGMRVCYRVCLSAGSQGRGCVSPITCSPLIILLPLHPWDYQSPLHPVLCGEEHQLRGPCGAGMGGWWHCGWAGCLGIPWIQ